MQWIQYMCNKKKSWEVFKTWVWEDWQSTLPKPGTQFKLCEALTATQRLKDELKAVTAITDSLTFEVDPRTLNQESWVFLQASLYHPSLSPLVRLSSHPLSPAEFLHPLLFSEGAGTWESANYRKNISKLWEEKKHVYFDESWNPSQKGTVFTLLHLQEFVTLFWRSNCQFHSPKWKYFVISSKNASISTQYDHLFISFKVF